MPEVSQTRNPQTTQSPQKPKRNWKKTFLFLLISLFLISLVGVGIYLLIPKPAKETISINQPQKQATPSAQKDETVGWKTFTGSTGVIGGSDETGVRFSVNYPSNLATKDRDHNYALVHSSPYRLAGPEQPGEISVLLGTYVESGKKTIAEGYNGKVTVTTLGGKKATRHTHTSSNAGITNNIVNYVVMDVGKNNWGFEFRCLYFPKDGLDLEKTCDLMASTFRFE